MGFDKGEGKKMGGEPTPVSDSEPAILGAGPRRGELTRGADLHGFFRDQVARAVEHQRSPLSEGVVYYLTNLLAERAHGDELPGGSTALVDMRRRALAAGPGEAAALWRRLGDYAMIVAGFFQESIRRRAVDRGYYEEMGASAYRAVEGRLWRTEVSLFGELAERFHTCTEVLTEVREEVRDHQNEDVLALYEAWLASGSPRLAARLQALGVVPVGSGGSG